MRFLIFMAGALAAGTLSAQGPLAVRYTFEVDEEAFPQKRPDEALKSVVRAIAMQKYDYFMAQLVDPAYVDRRVAVYKKGFDKGKEEGKALRAFQRLVKEIEEHFLEDPALVQDLKRFAKEAEWKQEEGRAVGTVKALAGRQVFLRRIGERWFFENRQRDVEKEPEKEK
jgi:hypothetical protein